MSISSELVMTAAVSFLLGWTLKNNNLIQLIRRSRNITNPSNFMKLAIVVRTDLSMSRGKIASQCSHAAVTNYKQGLIICPELIKQWETVGQPKIILRTKSGEKGLLELEKQAKNAGLLTSVIRDAGLTQIPSKTATVLAIGPDYSSKINKITSDLGLL